MKLFTGDKTYDDIQFYPTPDGCTIATAVPVIPGETLKITADDGAILREYTVADYLRCTVNGCTLTLSNSPEIEHEPQTPYEPPDPGLPQDEINAQAIAELSIAQAQGRAVTNQALAELSSLFAGGKENAI